jgi:AAA15 family ATPase/GTPase
MLKSFTLSNFYSIGIEPQTLSLEVSRKDLLNDSFSERGSSYFTLLAGIVGANGSGKSNILRGLSFLISLIKDSYHTHSTDANLSYRTHSLYSHENSFMEIEFFSKEDLYRYTIIFTREQIRKEVLVKKTHGQSRFVQIFSLNRDAKNNLKIPDIDINKVDKQRFLDRQNVPILSGLLSTGYLPNIVFFNQCHFSIDTNYTILRHFVSFSTEQELSENQALQKKTKSLLKTVDMAITDLVFDDCSLIGKNENVKILKFKHKTNTGREFELFFGEESHGTQAAFGLFLKIIPVLENGGIMVIDEIETNIHPHLIQKILSLFLDKKINKHNAQILFTTHQALLLKELTKTQIFVIEKNKENLSTELYRLDEVEGVRNDENHAQKYLNGAYGGIPDIDWLARGV